MWNITRTHDYYAFGSLMPGRKFNTTIILLTCDDKAMLNCGVKEIWNLASAETKTHIAIFKLSTRKDGLGERPVNGTKSTLGSADFILLPGIITLPIIRPKICRFCSNIEKGLTYGPLS